MTTATITEQYILNAIQQQNRGEQFPILFDEIWESSGYTQKHHAVRFLKNCPGLIKDEDYIVSPERVQTPQGGRPNDLIRMSRKGYRFFLTKSNTAQGYANLRYLIEVEDRYREHLERQLTAPQVDLKEFEAKIRREEEEKAYWQRLHDLNSVIDKVKALQKSNSYLRNQLEYSEQRREQLHVEYQDKNSDLEAEIKELKREIYKIMETEKRQVFNHFRICFLHTCMEVIYQMIPIWDECRLPELAAKLSIIKTYLDKTYENSCHIVNTLDLNEDTDAAMREREKQKKDFIRFFDAYKLE